MITMRAFAPKGARVTVQDDTERGCKERIKQICRDKGLPLRRTLATARKIKSPYYGRQTVTNWNGRKLGKEGI